MDLAFARKEGQGQGGLVSDEARTGKRFPVQLPIKIHKAERGDTAALPAI